MRRAGLVLALVVLAGCASPSGWPFARASATLLARADRLAGQGDYEAAVAAYDEFLATYDDDSEAPRVRVTRETASAIVRARAELARLRQELARREAELQKTRLEADRLRGDLEQLKQIDLRLERRGKK